MSPTFVPSRAAICQVCGTPLSALDARTRRVCRSAVCAPRHRALDARHTCAVCDRPLAVTEWAMGVCVDAACRDAWLIDRRAHEAHVRASRLRAEATALRDASAAAAGVTSAADYPVTVTPAADGELAPLPLHRRRAFEARLHVLLGRLASASAAGTPLAPGILPEAPPPFGPAVAATLGAACAGCRGACCHTAGDHAYLTAWTLQRWLDAHPGAGPHDVVAAYLEHAGPMTYRDSCVFHGPEGCRLPHALRSDTCNRYFCSELASLVRAPARPRFLAAADDRGVRRGAFVNGDDVRPAGAP